MHEGSMTAQYTIPCKAIVTYAPDEWRLEDVLLREPERGELLVETVASGVCHTDVQNVGGICPRVLGHEGAGIVKQVHPSVRKCAIGDPVLLSFARCAKCYSCLRGHPAHCDLNNPLTIHAREPNYALAHGEDDRLMGDEHGRKRIIPASYFGQSSFSSVALVKESSVVNASSLINNHQELRLFAPLGCGIQTGACSITNVAKPGPDDSVAVIGIGAVGLAAIVAAKISGVSNIVAIDLVQSRLDVAMTLGATHQINSNHIDKDAGLATAIRALPPFEQTMLKLSELHDPPSGIALPRGPSVIVDTTGVPAVMLEALKAVAPMGRVVQITNQGPGSTIPIPLPEHMRNGTSFTGTIQGDADPDQSIKMLIGWYRDGHLPLEKLEKEFPAENWKEALTALHDGSIVKAVLRW